MLKHFYLAVLLISILSLSAYSQQEFSTDLYKQFLQSNQNLSASDLLQSHPAGVFTSALNLNPSGAYFFDSISIKYQLTESEKELISQNGFMVTERLSYPGMGYAFMNIWEKDLPVFVSTDAILHALHMSYDEILKRCEIYEMIPRLKVLLNKLHQQVPFLMTEYSANPEMTGALKDLDLYLAVARSFFNYAQGYYPENRPKVTEIKNLIAQLQPYDVALFGDSPRTIDFSQFKVRGHYTDEHYPDLAKYFQCMIWLGRTELYLLAPRAQFPAPSFSDVQEQIICTFLLQKAMNQSNAMDLWKEIDSMLQFFVGESDNVTLNDVINLKQMASVSDPDALTDSNKVVEFQNILKTQPFAYQKILSQIILTGFDQADSIIPASAFLLFGQRFVVDSYVTSQVVFDRITYNNSRIKRLLPSTLDILFSLGNNAAAQLLQGELDKFHYSTNLAALRYLIDSYEPAWWKSTLYNNWLNAIRMLNPPGKRSNLPQFMQTAAYWQEKINTQLASWSQLRHDNLLYAKQSYTGGITCSYPFSYVEPIPDFYEAVHQYALAADEYFSGLPDLSTNISSLVDRYFKFTADICDTLKEITIKELNGTELTQKEKSFLSKMLYELQGCGSAVVDGWYPRLFVNGESSLLKADYIVADVHTVPTDEDGNPVGWILHAGTGPVNLGVFIVKDRSGQDRAYAGPVLSYYEHVTKNFYRFSDEEWAEAYSKEPSFRPSFINSYLADQDGNLRPEGMKLLTGVINDGNNVSPVSYILVNNYPNPFNASTTFNFTVPLNLSNSVVKLKIFNIQGELVNELVNEQLPAGNYFVRWYATDNRKNELASGIYLYNLQVGNNNVSGKMTLLK